MNDSLSKATADSPTPSLPRPEMGSLFSEMVDWMLVPFLLVWPLSVGVTYLIGIEISNNAFDRSLGSKTRALSEQISWNAQNNAVELRADLTTILADEDTETNHYRIDSTRGDYLLGEPELPIFAPSQVFSADKPLFKTTEFRDTEIRLSAIARSNKSGRETVIVYVAENISKRKALAYEIMKGIVLPQLFVVPLMILLMWLGLRRGIAPLKKLRDRMVAARRTRGRCTKARYRQRGAPVAHAACGHTHAG
jgi:two-component system, OmpR family, sensor histidine kinase TctE